MVSGFAGSGIRSSDTRNTVPETGARTIGERMAQQGDVGGVARGLRPQVKLIFSGRKGRTTHLLNR